MKARASYRVTLGAYVIAGLLAGCGRQSAAPPLYPSLIAPACLDCDRPGDKTTRALMGYGTVFTLTTSGSQRILHSFSGGLSDGAQPESGLIEVNGTLYGTTESGGSNGQGTVFTISSSGAESVLHSFGGSGDGSEPVASLVYVKGTLYGTTEYGGASDLGTVFSITTSGSESVLHSFSGYATTGISDGALPASLLLNVNGALYGTTQAGGDGPCSDNFKQGSEVFGCGAVFKITTSGSEKLLFNFDGTHGWRPYGGMINVNGTLYGTTAWLPDTEGAGSVFSITPSGKEAELYAFKALSSDGADPYSTLVDVNGTLYGTTYHGGAEGCGTKGCGTVFSITPSGKEKVLYRFTKAERDGKHPYGGLVNVNGTLYGTTYAGGVTGRGTAFAITTSGTEKTIHTFGLDNKAGKAPFAGFLNIKGTLYGTTQYGGAP